MANRASDEADREEGADPFPWVVSLGCLVVGIALFLHSTMPALAEQRELERIEREMLDEFQATADEVGDVQRRAWAVETDPETIRVEIDAHRLTVQEAIELHGAQSPEAGTDDSGPGAPASRGR